MSVTIAIASTDFVSRFVISEAAWAEVIVSEVIESMLAILLERVESLESAMPEASTVTSEPWPAVVSCEHLSRNEPRLLVLFDRLTVPRMPLAAMPLRPPATALSWSPIDCDECTMPVASTRASVALVSSGVITDAVTVLSMVRLMMKSIALMLATISTQYSADMPEASTVTVELAALVFSRMASRLAALTALVMVNVP